MRVKVRVAQLEDVPAIRQLVGQHWPADLDYRKEVKNSDVVFLVADAGSGSTRLGGSLLGVALMRVTKWNRTGYLLEFAVDKAHKRMGIGSKMMKALARGAKERGLRAIIVETQPDSKEAMDFYLGSGLRLCGYNDRYYTNKPMNSHQIAVFFSLDLEHGKA
ncbi:MAG TPA: N-acetyltransferase [Nitrososphaerales archaeon]|nr:N-acetyltransferase [Nitrososphaerales archaeon]